MGKFYTHVHQHRGKMLVRGFDDNGHRVHKTVPYAPYLFIPAKQGQQTNFRSLQGQPLGRMRFDSIKEARDFVKEYEGIENFNVYGSNEWVPMYIYDNYKGSSRRVSIRLLSTSVLSISKPTSKREESILRIRMPRSRQSLFVRMVRLLRSDTRTSLLRRLTSYIISAITRLSSSISSSRSGKNST
jgi:hypothetical protein